MSEYVTARLLYGMNWQKTPNPSSHHHLRRLSAVQHWFTARRFVDGNLASMSVRAVAVSGFLAWWTEV
jgi:hypothetical protein